MSERPLVEFVVGGVQKGGTTALAAFLGRHPGLALPRSKEAHVFDAAGFDDEADVATINRSYVRHFRHVDPGALYGDATPIYVLHPRLVERVARYNPRMKWVLVLRHPVERAVSQYWMERGRDAETLPLWPAMLLERWRLRGPRAHGLSPGSALRRHSYRLRGDYAAQLDALYAHFPRGQVLVLRNAELGRAPAETLARVHRFLGVEERPEDGRFDRVFEGGYPRLRRGTLQWRLMCWLMRRELADAKARYGLDWD